jgi:pimeloyl-ACP methyl ester carboxylesterase
MDIIALADSLGLGKFAVLGVSGGGGYVAACARFIPERLSVAVIVTGMRSQAGSPLWMDTLISGKSTACGHTLR